MLSKQDLFARLAEGHAARISVVTPNTRLAQALQAEFDSFQIKKRISLWEAPDILPFGAFVERLYEDALYSDIAAGLPLLLTSAKEELLWQDAVRHSSRDLLATEEAAAQCREAWKLAHEWRIRGGPGNEDTAAFALWREMYGKKTAHRLKWTGTGPWRLLATDSSPLSGLRVLMPLPVSVLRG